MSSPWGKTTSDGRRRSLHQHCLDVGLCFAALLGQPVIRRRVESAAGRSLDPVTEARLVALAHLHDVGKLNAGFQLKALGARPPPPWCPAGHVGEGLRLLFGAEETEHVGEALRLDPLGNTALPGRAPADRALWLRDALRRWLEKRTAAAAFIWAREPDGALGEHIHVALHLPEGRDEEFVRQLESWTGCRRHRRALLRGPRIARSRCGTWDFRRHVARLGGTDAKLAAYIAKAATSSRGRGPIEGKRSGATRSIGEQARARHQWSCVFGDPDQRGHRQAEAWRSRQPSACGSQLISAKSGEG